MMDEKRASMSVRGRWVDINEVRLISDLRIMHAKVDELYQIVQNLKRRHNEEAIYNYADHSLLQEDIDHVDQIYLWFVALKEESRKKSA
jgi:hypothetical protein